MEIVIEELQVHKPVSGGIAFGEGVCLAGKGIEPITQGAVEPFDMHGASWLHPCPQRGAGLYREQSSVLIAMLDGLRQGDRLWNDRRRTPLFAHPHRLSIGPHQDAPIAAPPIAEPVQLALMSPLDRGGHGLLDQVLAQRTGRAGDHEATVSILDQASPAFSLVRLAGSAVFFCTNAALLIDLHLAQVQIAGQHRCEGGRMGRRPLQPPTDRLVFVPRDLFGRSQAASSHHD